MKQYEIQNVVFDEDFGGLIVSVEVNGKMYDFMQQYNIDEEDGELSIDADCWAYIDDVCISGTERSESRVNLNILKKLSQFEDKNRYVVAERAWELFNEVMKEAKGIYEEDLQLKNMVRLNICIPECPAPPKSANMKRFSGNSPKTCKQ